jgi:hypothetical protein
MARSAYHEVAKFGLMPLRSRGAPAWGLVIEREAGDEQRDDELCRGLALRVAGGCGRTVHLPASPCAPRVANVAAQIPLIVMRANGVFMARPKASSRRQAAHNCSCRRPLRGGPFVCDTPNDLVTCLAMPALRAGGRLRRSAQPLPTALPCASSAANLRVTEVVRVHRAVRHAGAVVTAPGRAAASRLRRPGYVVGSRCKCLACTRPPVRGLITPIGRYVCASRALPCRS